MIRLREKVGYGFGDMASSMFWKLFGSYLMIFYTDVFGLPAAVVGTMFLVTRVWDSAFDPIVGVIADRTRSRWGKFRPYLLWLCVPFALIGVLTFTTPSLGLTGKIVYAYATYSLMMMVYSAINVPYASLLGVMSPDPRDRNVLSTYRMTLSTYRMTFAYIGSFIALLLFMPMTNFFSGGDPSVEAQQHGWMMSVAVIGALCAVLFYGCFALTRERVKPVREKQAPLLDDLKDLLGNRPWWILRICWATARGGSCSVPVSRPWSSTRSVTARRSTTSSITSSRRSIRPSRSSGCRSSSRGSIWPSGKRPTSWA